MGLPVSDLSAALAKALEAARVIERHFLAHGHLGAPVDTRPETDIIDPSTGKIISQGQWNVAHTEYRSPGVSGGPIPRPEDVAAALVDAQQQLALVQQLVPTSAVVPPAPPPMDGPPPVVATQDLVAGG